MVSKIPRDAVSPAVYSPSIPGGWATTVGGSCSGCPGKAAKRFEILFAGFNVVKLGRIKRSKIPVVVRMLWIEVLVGVC